MKNCFVEENRPRIRKENEKMPNIDRYRETTKDFDESDYCIVFLKDGSTVFTTQKWHSCIVWWSNIENKSDIVDWDYASPKEIYENKKEELTNKINKLKNELEEAENELNNLEIKIA